MSGVAAVKSERTHFLPIQTNTFDRVFISVVLYIAIHLLWMRFVEFYAPLWIATGLSLLIAVIIIRRG
jgi:predicted small integral membrane protein